ncbi:MAG: serine/threonine-protein kinase [Myxococcales bacterium]|nr:serine/threonine-protein kinase [Myxococcales bacterium]
MRSSVFPSGPPRPTRIAARYQIEGSLGSGGMAEVHRALDLSTGEHVALKVLHMTDDGHGQRAAKLFEQEFHTLMQLAHPRIVRVFDYGLDEAAGPFYTMELLSGGDLRELAPLPWQRACEIAYAACSALAFLHSRRLVHRDITPRNIRCTADGQARLIDFGLLAPFGPSTLVAGTPPYMAPEVLNQVSLDGRSDMFSLGATLYHALTGRVPYPVRSMRKLREAWRTKPAPPSELVEGIPPEVDALVLALIRPNPNSRPKNTAEVLDRLKPMLSSVPDELQTARAYLTTPSLVGRAEPLEQIRRRALRALRRRGGGFVIEGEAGTGRSRMLDGFVLEAKLVGARSVRASGLERSDRPFGVASALLAQLARTLPESVAAFRKENRPACELLFDRAEAPSQDQGPGLAEDSAVRDLADPTLSRGTVHEAIRKFIQSIADKRPLAIAIDDFHAVDEPSAAAFASFAQAAKRRRVVYAVTLQSGTPPVAPKAVEVLQRHAATLNLAPLSLEDMTALLSSVFGSVPNVSLLAQRLHRLANGRPRECLELAQHLVDAGLVTYEGSGWTLPRELPSDALPSSMAEALSQRVDQLSPAARGLAELLALSLLGHLSADQLASTEVTGETGLHGPIAELRSAQVLVGDEASYRLAHGEWRRVLLAGLDDQTARNLHRLLARALSDEHDSVVHAAHHLIHAGEAEEAYSLLCPHELDVMAQLERLRCELAGIGGAQGAEAVLAALQHAEREGRPAVELFVLRWSLAGMSAFGEDPRYYAYVAKDLLAQAKKDSGYDDWLQLSAHEDPQQRLFAALSAAQARFDETPEAQRVCAPSDGIRALANHVVMSIAVGSRILDDKLIDGLPALLEPFASLSPLLDALWGNACATRLAACQGNTVRAREVWLGVLERLEAVEQDAMVQAIVTAICYGIGLAEARIGLPSVTTWADRLDAEPAQAVNAQHIRRLAALQRGNWEDAERHRAHAELLLLQDNPPQMFQGPNAELIPYMVARDLTGTKQVAARIGALAETYPGWEPWRLAAESACARLRGELLLALEHAEAGLAMTRDEALDEGVPGPAWATLTLMKVQALIEQGRTSEATTIGTRALDACQRYQLPTDDLERAVALAEGMEGDAATGLQRLDALTARQRARGVEGLLLGASYESAARVCMANDHLSEFRRYANLAAEQYRPNKSSVLGARYERLMEEAGQRGLVSGIPPARISGGLAGDRSGARPRIMTAISGCDDAEERATRGLALLFEATSARRGYLYLVGEDGLQLAATNADATSSPHLTGWLAQYVAAQTEGIDSAVTETQEECEATQANVTGACTFIGGSPYQAIPLLGRQGENQLLAGVAVVSIDRAVDLNEATQVAAALAEYLVECGDAKWKMMV